MLMPAYLRALGRTRLSDLCQLRHIQRVRECQLRLPFDHHGADKSDVGDSRSVTYQKHACVPIDLGVKDHFKTVQPRSYHYGT